MTEKKKYFTLQLLLVIIISAGCSNNYSNSGFIGFWEGPHPEDENKKFYIHVELMDDSVTASGYWTNHRFYQESFRIDNMRLKANTISFKIPDWNCEYQGVRTDNKNIIGGFECTGEPFDEVCLIKNDDAGKYLIEPKPGSDEVGYTYSYTKPEEGEDKIISAQFESARDSVFICSLLSEVIEGKYGRLNSLLLFKNKRLVCEEYFFGYTKDDMHPIESCTKSITSLLIGIAWDKGYIKDINQPMGQLFPEYINLNQKDYRQITIRHLLAMTSGYNPDDENLFRSDDRIAFALKRELTASPGKKFQYDGGNTEILGGIIKKSSGMLTDEFAHKYLFKPLNITSYNWEIHKQNGNPSMAGALCLRPRDMGKIGLLILNKGAFSGNRIVSENWIKESTSVKTKTHIPGNDYSYQWWNQNLKSGDKTYSAIWANGWGSQFIYIIPELEVVLVTTGHNYEGDSWEITRGISKYLHLLDH